MKPRIVNRGRWWGVGIWVCKGGDAIGVGSSPKEAYDRWSNNFFFRTED